MRFCTVKEICIIHHPPSMYASSMVLFFISWCFCSRSEFCHIMWYYGYNKYILKIARSSTVCASLANPHPNLSYIIYILYIDIKLNRPILVRVIDSFTNTVPSSIFWWYPHHLFDPLRFFRKLKPWKWAHGKLMENPWNTHGISLQQFGRHPGHATFQ